MKKVKIASVFLPIVFIPLLIYYTLSILSFKGSIAEIESNGHLLIDCPVLDFGARDDLGYVCRVQLSDETMITNGNGDILSFHNLELGDAVSVTLSKRQMLGKDVKKREVIATKIIRLRQEESP
ncbi:hypothetical protein [Ornithinibacillus scapharcae]|uniref:hypothetical protein n=1 Tax=Ornithinibacillus scapharcae TaxID=1147159 RepID=UPI000225BB7D|nr:hypothetical protein [Ornithinibacillus scapharcae]